MFLNSFQLCFHEIWDPRKDFTNGTATFSISNKEKKNHALRIHQVDPLKEFGNSGLIDHIALIIIFS